MDKKILVGSIIAVAVLIGVSFTSVVGFQSMKSTNIAETSPLFKVRTSRAIGKESEDLTCKYVGQGNTLPIPKQDGNEVLIRIIIDNIRMMDDKTFEKAIAFLIDSMQEDIKFNRINSNEIREALYLIKSSDKSIPLFNANSDNKRFDYYPNRFLAWTLSKEFCFIKFIFMIIFYSAIGFLFWCSNSPPTGVLTGCCGPTLDCPKTLRRLLP